MSLGKKIKRSLTAQLHVKDLGNSLHHRPEEEVRLPTDEYEGIERLEENEIAFIFDQDL